MTTNATSIDRRTTGLIAIAALFAIALILTTALLPQSRRMLLEEDGPLENLSVAFFSLAAIAGWFKWAKAGRNDRIMLVMAGFCTIAALDELSFGERIFGFTAPVINGVKIDGLHDLGDLAKTTLLQLPGSPYLWAVLLAAILAPIAVWVGLKLRAAGWRWPSRNDVIPIGAAAAFIAVAVLVDIGFRPVNYPIIHALGVEEIFETTAGLLLALFVLSRPMGETAGAEA